MAFLSRVKEWVDAEVLEANELNAEFDAIVDNIVTGTTAAVGLVQLEDSHASTSTTKAACPKNVKEAYDLAGTMLTKAAFDAGTFMYAVNDNTPVKKTRAEILALLSGQSGADFSMGTHKITAVTDPTANQDAATKKYVDDNALLDATFDANTIMKADSDNTPVALTVAASRILGRKATGSIAAMTKAEALTVLNIEDAADVTDATNVNAAGAVMESDYDAATFLYATDNNTPIVKTRAEVMALLSGQTAADFAMNTHKLTGVVDPTANQDAATKKYVDDNSSWPQAALNSSLDVRDFIHDDGSGTNNVISTMAFIPRFKTSGWPQAALNGLEVGGFWVDVYEASQPDASSTSRGSTAANTPGAVAACSRSGVVPWTDISWLNARIAASNRTVNGRSCHLITPFERFSILSLIMAAGQWGQQRGNNDNGKDTRDADSWENYGITDPVRAAYRKLTGSGPPSWWHNGLPGRGIHNLVANIYEWEDLRLESGFIQPKAYLAGATSAAATYIDYDDNALGDTAYIHQLTPGIYTITDATNGNENVTIERVIITGRFTGRAILASATTLAHIDNAPMQLTTAVDLSDGVSAAWAAIGKLLEDATGKYMALPDKADTTTHASTYLDSWYKCDNADSRVLLRCGYWVATTKARSGLVVHTGYMPTDTHYHIGFRGALSISNL